MKQLQFHFDTNRPIYVQLVAQLELYIISGALPPGERIPSVRDLAVMAKVNPNTMQRALTELEERKLIFTERTNGKYVNSSPEAIQQNRQKYACQRIREFTAEMTRLGFKPQEVIKMLKKEEKV